MTDTETITGEDAHMNGGEPRTSTEPDAHMDSAEPRTSTEPDAHTAANDVRDKHFSTRLSEEEMDGLVLLMKDGESKADFLCRLIAAAVNVPIIEGQMDDLASEIEVVRAANTEIRKDFQTEQQHHQKKFDDHVHEIGQLRAQVTSLTNQVETGLVTTGGHDMEDSFGSTGMKDIADEIREGCAGDESCLGTVVKLQQSRIAAMSNHLDREHDTEQKQLAREHDATQRQVELDAKKEQQEKDRALKDDLAKREHENKIELQLAKKGGFKQEFLNDIVFVSGGVSKHPKKDLSEAQKRAHQQTSGDDQWLNADPETEEELAMHTDFDEDQI